MTDPSKSSRRAFLSGRSAVEALSGALTEPPQPLPAPTSATGVQPGSHLLSVSREAMACLFEIVYDAAQYRNQTDVAVAALDLVEALEGQLTVYHENSEVMEINRRAMHGPVLIERGLYELLNRATALSKATNGAFDFTAGRLSKIWGFYRRQGQMPAQTEIDEALSGVGVDGLVLDDEQGSIRFTRPELELNLGAIGKGYALDRAAAALQAGGIRDFLIHGGNSSVLAHGSRLAAFESQSSDLQTGSQADTSESTTENQEQKIGPGWSVALRHPLRPGVRLAEFVLRDQALGTSGSGTQYFHHQGRRYGHILDPRTGWPADQVLSATVIAPTAEQADALSTAFYVLGVEPARQYCSAHLEIAALLCMTANSSTEVELFPINLTADAWSRV